jgi:F-type H+-transporting ATPase subunit gamma
MSGTTESLSKKIAGANDLQGVVRSMKALAASSIGQYQRATQSLDTYYRTVELALTACLRLAPPESSPDNKGSRRGVVVGAVLFGSDQGLVGRFNEILIEYATGRLKALPGKTTKIWAVGDRIQALVADSGLAPSSLLSVPASVDAITAFVGQILVEIQQAREHEGVTEVHIFHNHPTSGTFYEPVGKRLFPLDLAWQKKIGALPWPTNSLPEVMEGIVPALAAFVREYLFVLLFQACAESLASENASRLAAMQRAEKNIEDILDDLNRSFHRIRQETIDEELFDVISGFDALTTRHVSSDHKRPG